MNENTTLFILLSRLREAGIGEHLLQEKYNLSRQSLWRIRKGKDLTLAHGYYFRCFVMEVHELRLKALRSADINHYREYTDLLFLVMAMELKLDFLL